MNLRIDYCDNKAALFACQRWHYSKTLPTAGGNIKYGVWENNIFVGAVIYSRGANKHINSPYKLKKNEVCELVRVALSNQHKSPTSKIVSITLKMLKKDFPNLKIIVSYADENQGHKGTIYKAMNWVYEGEFANEQGISINGKLIHRRTINSKYGTSSIEKLKSMLNTDMIKVINGLPKHKFHYVLRSKHLSDVPDSNQDKAVQARPERSNLQKTQTCDMPK